MITIKLHRVSENFYNIRDFFKSISSQASSKECYEIIKGDIFFGENIFLYDEFKDQINFSDEPSIRSKIEITLPDNCLVLHKDWDKYINYNLDNDRIIDKNYVKKRMSLVGKPDNGVFPGLSINIKNGEFA